MNSDKHQHNIIVVAHCNLQSAQLAELRAHISDRARVIWVNPLKMPCQEGELRWGKTATRHALHQILRLPNTMAITSHTVAGWFPITEGARFKIYPISDKITHRELLGQALGWLSRLRDT